MRYTTLIDIRELPTVYRNTNARLVYLHLALVAGYHDHDRDLANVSLRRLAMDAGLTVAATRHALAVLERAQLIKRQGSVIMVRKWLAEQPVTARPKSAKQQAKITAEAAAKAEREQRAQALELERAQRLHELAVTGKTPFMRYYESKLALAQAGDIEAQAIVDARRSQYEQAVELQRQRIEATGEQHQEQTTTTNQSNNDQ